MPKIDRQEDETLEFKRQWTDRALEDLAAFANTRGGTLLVGIREDGEIVGAAADDREIQLFRRADRALGAPGPPESWSSAAGRACRNPNLRTTKAASSSPSPRTPIPPSACGRWD